jgi:3-oxoacyl-[acyl-carrier-protein] synthase I
MGKQRRVAITGIGIISCLGIGIDEVRESLRQSKSGIHYLQSRKDLGFQSGLSARIPEIDYKKILDRKRRKSMTEYGIWAWMAILEGLSCAGIKPESLQGDSRTGMIFGNDSSARTAVEQVEMLRESGQSTRIGSGHIFRLLNSTITMNITTILGIKGKSWTVSSACASGGMAIGQGAQLISSGQQDRVICGGAQEITWQSMCSFDALGAFASREDSPAEASRPFDKARDGLVPGGGAAAVILEDYETAKARGAEILAEVLGYGTASDGHHIVVPSGEGLENAINEAIDDSGLKPEDIDLVMAHATSTPTGDLAEVKALKNIFIPPEKEEKNGPAITAIKGLTGHEFWMAGSAQVVYSIIMSQAGFITPIANLEEPDPEAAPLNLLKKSITARPEHILCNAAGFGGANACLVIGVKHKS